ncbi:alcohol dehydrogenase catalytic domain-containing protein [Lutibacter sp. B2]|nr:alcohol dehydrogenase catalytic domain-containing protein [Lutibacter sp. B2]
MLTKGFKISGPKRFEIYIDNVKVKKDEALIKVDTATICKADLRYYLGKRDERVLGLKYPMNLLHEAIGTIIKDPSGTFNNGDRVVLVPNLIFECDKSSCNLDICNRKELGENYCPKAKFASSSFNGFSREYLSYPVRNLVKIPSNIENHIAVLCELISVACAAIRRVNIREGYTIAVWGDGILGYILCSVLKVMHDVKIIAIGKHEEKLKQLEVDDIYLVNDKEIYMQNIDMAFECVGGIGSQYAIDEMIKCIKPGGDIVLTGVSEKKIEIDTRKILEKGISLKGVTRSNVDDFKKAVELFAYEDFVNNIEKLNLGEICIRNIVDFHHVFEKEVNNKKLGKYIMKFAY